MPIKIVHLDDNEYKTHIRGLRLLTQLIWICEQNEYETVLMGYISSLLCHEKRLVSDIKDMLPLEGEDEDMLWWLKHLKRIRENDKT